MLFCDLVGSTELSGRLDPEELRDLVGSYEDATAAVVDKRGGQIAQYLGDGVLVYFGYPVAHEDDAERAVRTGLGRPRSTPRVLEVSRCEPTDNTTRSTHAWGCHNGAASD